MTFGHMLIERIFAVFNPGQSSVVYVKKRNNAGAVYNVWNKQLFWFVSLFFYTTPMLIEFSLIKNNFTNSDEIWFFKLAFMTEAY